MNRQEKRKRAHRAKTPAHRLALAQAKLQVAEAREAVLKRILADVVATEHGGRYTAPVERLDTAPNFELRRHDGAVEVVIVSAAARSSEPCLDPDKMHGAGDEFGGSDY